MTEAGGGGTLALRRFSAALGIFIVVLCGAACQSGSGASSEQPTFDYVIPAGAGDRIDAGEPLAILPEELNAKLDETIQIVNLDDRAHVVGPWFVGAGVTLRQRFTVAGVFDGSCSVHPSGGFTVVVTE